MRVTTTMALIDGTLRPKPNRHIEALLSGEGNKPDPPHVYILTI
jgi:hypothetical protein